MYEHVKMVLEGGNGEGRKGFHGFLISGTTVAHSSAATASRAPSPSSRTEASAAENIRNQIEDCYNHLYGLLDIRMYIRIKQETYHGDSADDRHNHCGNGRDDSIDSTTDS